MAGDNVKVVHRPDGKTDNYFGGRGQADGDGHGHIVSTDRGEIVYARDSQKNGGKTVIDKRK